MLIKVEKVLEIYCDNDNVLPVYNFETFVKNAHGTKATKSYLLKS